MEVAPGDPLKVDFSITSAEITAGYSIWGRVFCAPSFTQRPECAVDSLARVYLIGGGRFFNASFDVRRETGTTASAAADEFFVEPIIGVRTELELARDFTIDLQVAGGGLPLGDKSSFSFDVAAGFQWRPIPNLGIQIGYRQLIYSLSDGKGTGEFKYSGALAGLFTGVVIRF